MNFNIHIDTMMRKLHVCTPADIFPVSGGMINQTFEVTGRSRERFIVQRIHPAFNKQTIEDQDVVCRHLEGAGFTAPSIVTWWEDEEDRLWKVTKLISHDGNPVQNDATVALAARHLAEIHASLKGLDYIPRPALKGFHDTPAIIRKLSGYIEQASAYGAGIEIDLVLKQGSRLTLPQAPASLIHGDPKWNNFLFGSLDECIFVAALIDWDTVMIGNPFMDIGDMIRSFCRRADGAFDYDRFKIIADNYRSGSEFREQAFVSAKVITLELAARFLIDVVEDSYFDFDRSKFSARRDSNIASAKKYIDYFKSM